MKTGVTACVLLASGSFACASRRATPQNEPGWSIYRNAKYGYQISYPEGYEVRATGREGERDGRSIRIGMKEYAASTPALDVELQPAEFRWKATGEIALVEIHREGVLLRFHAPSGLERFQGTIWWRMVATFAREAPAGASPTR